MNRKNLLPRLPIKAQQKFLSILFATILILCGKVNFMNLSRYGEITERTYRRQFSRSYNFMQRNAQLIATAIAGRQIIAVDCSFAPKSGKTTYGIEYFYNGSAGRAERGLEISVISIVDVEAKQGYTLSVQQTKPTQTESEKTRIDWYLEQLQVTKPYLPKSAHYVVTDGFYTKIKWVDGVKALNLDVVGKLRCDADLRYVYEGAQKPRGRHRKYDGKVDLIDLSRMTLVREVEPHLHLYTVVVWVLSLKRQVRLAYLLDSRNPERTGQILLFSTDINLDASEILCFYKARFQIEFIFRDAKQFTGLTDCQARDLTKLDFHFNASLMALNLAKLDAFQLHKANHPDQPFVFSMASYKRLALNRHLLERFISLLDLEPTLIKSHPNFSKLCYYGAIAA